MTADKDGVELLPCPFCGGEASDAGHIAYNRALDDTTWADGSPVTEAFYVNCIACGAVARSGFVGGFQTKVEAIERWNHRARPTPAQEQGWMPIETAPRDGWKILATDRFHQERTWVVWWKGNEWVCDHHNGRVVGLTDWRPLPSTPTEGGEDA